MKRLTTAEGVAISHPLTLTAVRRASSATSIIDGDLSIVGTTLSGVMAGTGQTTIAQGAEAVTDQFLRLEGSRTLVNNGTLDIVASLDLIDDTSVSNFGLINVDPGDNPNLQIGSTNGVGLLVNEASGTIVVRPAPFLDENAAPSSGGLVNVLTNFDNAGTVTLESGFLRLFGDGTHTGAFQLSGMLEGGTLDGARLRTFGSNVFEESASVTGVSFGVQGGTTTFDGTLAVESTFVLGDATFTLNTDTSTRLLSIFGSDEASFGAPEALPTFGGTGNVTVTESFSFEEGAIVGSGLIDVQAGATTTLGSTFFTTAAPQLSLSGRTIRNAAAFTSSEDPEATASVFSQGNLQIQNGGVFEQVGDLRVTGEGGLGTSITVDETTSGQFILSGTLKLDEALAITGADLTGGGISIGDGFLSLNEDLTVGAFEMTTGTLNLDGGNLTILNTASLSGTLSGSGQTTIASGAEGTVAGNLLLSGNPTLLNEGLLNFANDFDTLTLQDSAQLQIGSNGTLQLDGSQSVNTFAPSDANGEPTIPNTRIVNNGRIERLDTAGLGGTFSSLSASTLDLNGTIDVVAGTLNIDALNIGFVDEGGFFVTTAEGVATYGSASSLIGGDAGIQLHGGRHQFTAGAASTWGPSSQRADFRRRPFHRRYIDAGRRHGRNGANHDRPRC